MTRDSMIPVIGIAIWLFSASASSTEYRKEGSLIALEAHANRPASTSTQNREFLSLSADPAWIIHSGSGGTLCPETAAVLPLNNSILRAIALTAIASRATVFVIVDSTVTRVAGVCEVVSISITGG